MLARLLSHLLYLLSLASLSRLLTPTGPSTSLPHTLLSGFALWSKCWAAVHVSAAGYSPTSLQALFHSCTPDERWILIYSAIFFLCCFSPSPARSWLRERYSYQTLLVLLAVRFWKVWLHTSFSRCFFFSSSPFFSFFLSFFLLLGEWNEESHSLPQIYWKEMYIRKSQIICLFLKAAVPNHFGTRDRFHGGQFFHRPGRGGGAVSGWFKCITFIEHFISIIMTSAHLRSSGIRSQRLETPALKHALGHCPQPWIPAGILYLPCLLSVSSKKVGWGMQGPEMEA